MKELRNLSEVYKNYDTFVIDLWGVMHNGVILNSKAVEAVDQLKNNSKKIVFLSNAPRPSSKVINFLLKMKMNSKYLSNVMTSGEAAMHAINKNKFGKTFFHLGPPKDTSVFENVKDNKVADLKSCDFILCTGLFEEYENDMEYYKNFLKEHISKTLVCTNPDLTVHRGNEEELCAGSLAKVFEELSKRYSARKGGYSRVLKAGFRTGDDAPMAVIELVDRNPEAKKIDKPKKTDPKDNKKKEAQVEPKVAKK